MDTRSALPVNMVLDDCYRIERVVGAGGFGITYQALDLSLGTTVALKEYYPSEFGDRDDGMSVHPRSQRHKATFDWGRANFLEEARTLARFEHPAIVQVLRVFEANATAYMVMRFEEGRSLEDWLATLGRLPTQAELDAIVAPLLDALELMHAADFLHRDIAPDNIIVRADGSPVLLDFGAARCAVAAAGRTLTGIVKAGYSPHEQYCSDPRLQGPWSDLYALGGTLYRAVMGRPPEEAALRVTEDRMPPAMQVAAKGRFHPRFLAGIDACLKVRHAERPRAVCELRGLLLERTSPSRRVSEPIVAALRLVSRPLSRPVAALPQAAAALTARWIVPAVTAIALLGGVCAGIAFARWHPAHADPAPIEHTSGPANTDARQPAVAPARR